MKLRNKKTGEILGSLGSFIIQNPNGINCEAITKYDSLAELNEDWEDYEAPEDWWFIGRDYEPHATNSTLRNLEADREIGNYFETKEEAEKAVEKLKAWKRLRDRGVVLDSFEGAESCNNFYRIIFSIRHDRYWLDSSHPVEKDLRLLLGGEE